MPPMLEDLVERYFGGEVPMRAKEDVPSVSFCGMALPLGLPPGKKWVKESLRVLGYRLGLVKGVPVGYAPRALAIRALERARGVRCDFVVRRHSLVQFRWGHLLAADDQGKVVSAAQANDQRADYVKNLTGSDYVLCVRGYGNYSLRPVRVPVRGADSHHREHGCRAAVRGADRLEVGGNLGGGRRDFATGGDRGGVSPAADGGVVRGVAAAGAGNLAGSSSRRRGFTGRRSGS